MRLTIINDDGAVYIDGKSVIVDCSSVDPAIHAVQWNVDRGLIEFRGDGINPKPENEEIFDISRFQTVIDLAADAIQKATFFSEMRPAASVSSIPPQPDPTWIYNPVKNEWEAP
jgi:hypothetical protein